MKEVTDEDIKRIVTRSAEMALHVYRGMGSCFAVEGFQKEEAIMTYALLIERFKAEMGRYEKTLSEEEREGYETCLRTIKKSFEEAERGRDEESTDVP